MRPLCQAPSWADRVPARPSGKTPTKASLRCSAIALSSDDEENELGDSRVCSWLEKLHSNGPVTLTPFDKQLWESLLDSKDTRRVKKQSNGNNNRWGPTLEEVIPSSTPTANLVAAMQSRQRSMAPPPEPDQFRSERVQSLSPSATPGEFRVVNWAAEPSDKRWNNRGAFGPGPPKPKGSWRRPKVFPKRISPRGVGAPGYIRRLKPYHQRQSLIMGAVSGVEMFLSSVLDSPQNGAGGEADKFQCPPSCLSRHCVVPNSLVPPSNNKQQSWQLGDRLTGCNVLKQFEVRNPASIGSQEVSVSRCRIEASETPWQPADKPNCSVPQNLRAGSSEMTMEFSGDSSSSPNDENEDDEIDTDQVDEATVRKFRDSPEIHMPQMRPSNLELFKTRRNVVISVSGGPRRIFNSKSASTNTERSASSLVNGASEGTQCNGAMEPQPVGGLTLQDDARQGELSNECSMENFNLTTGELVRQLSPHAPLQETELKFPAQVARMVLENSASFITPVWLSCRVEIRPVSVATIRQCLPDSSRFVWQRIQPAHCSRACCNLLSGPVDNSHSSEIRLALERCPVYIHHRDSQRALTAIIVASDCQFITFGVGIFFPVITTALRYIGPSDVVPVASPVFPIPFLAPAPSPPPLALPWPQPQITFPEWSRISGNHDSVVLPQARSLLFHAAPNGSEAVHNRNFSSQRQASRKSDQLRELRRIVRMRMHRKFRDNEYIGVPEPQCCCESSSSSLTASATAPSETDKPKRRIQSIGIGTAPIFQKEVPEHIVTSGWLDGRPSCRQSAAADSKEVATAQQQQQQEQQQQAGSATTEQLVCLAEFVERILHESCSQQTALNNLLSALKSSGGGIGCGNSSVKMAAAAKSEEAGVSACTVASVSLSKPSSSSISDCSTTEEQFYSVVGSVPDAATRATGLTADQFYSPAATTNNNAENVTSDASTMTSSVSGSKRHRTYYACKRIVRLEESAAILVQETTCQASSVVAAYPVHLDRDSSSSTPSNSYSNKNSAAKKRFSADRIRSLERRILIQAWRRNPPLEPRLLERLDPTMSSFVWWSLIPRYRRLAFRVNPHNPVSTNKKPSPTTQKSVDDRRQSPTTKVLVEPPPDTSEPSFSLELASPTEPSSRPQPSTPTQPSSPTQPLLSLLAESCEAPSPSLESPDLNPANVVTSCELEMHDQSSSSTLPSSVDLYAIELNDGMAALSMLTFGK